MRSRHHAGAFLATMAAAILTIGTACAQEAQDVPADLPATSQTVSGATVVTRPFSYNYEPSAFKEGSTYHLYWCAGVAGDHVLHAQSGSLKGPWRGTNSPVPPRGAFGRPGGTTPPTFLDTSLKPTGNPADFDGQHTCDPAVIKLYGYYYMYYTGLGYAGGTSAIGVAASRDPVHFGRLNGGRPIVNPAKTNPGWDKRPATRYGAGQPAVLYVAPYVYLAFTDTTAIGSDNLYAGGQYALRSQDPAFQSGVQELTAAGWVDRTPGRHTGEHPFMGTVAMDWAYDERTGRILVLTSNVGRTLALTALDRDTLATVGTGTMPMDWREGPGLLAAADRRMLERPSCASAPVAAFAAAGASFDPYSWTSIDLSVSTFDLGAICPAE